MVHDETIDLRSDTVTRPCKAMRAAMAVAPVGDDVSGEDPTIRRLERQAAEICGKQAGLFVPSGCIANLAAQMVYCDRGDEVIVGRESHCAIHASGGGGALAGVQYEALAEPLVGADAMLAAVKPQGSLEIHTSLVWVENTHNMGGGLVYSLERLAEIRRACDSVGLPLHMDGARLFNAVVASGASAASIAEHVDSLSFALSKGLAAPVGSVLVGTHEFRQKANRLRKRLGGGWRQAGILAAAGIYALEHNVERLAEDHANARCLAQRLAEHPGVCVDLETVQTNIVVAGVGSPQRAEALTARCEERGVAFYCVGRGRVRFVTHRDISAEQVEHAADTIVAELNAL